MMCKVSALRLLPAASLAALALTVILSGGVVDAFSVQVRNAACAHASTRRRNNFMLRPDGSIVSLSSRKDDDDEAGNTRVGSSEYYKGFVSRSVDEEPAERVTGDAILGPTLKFAGGIGAVLVVLTLVFLASNGII